MDESNIRSRLREWILGHAKGKALGTPFDDQTPLLETGLLSSLDIVEFVLFIEELLGDEVDPDDIEPEAFTDVDSLWAAFFSDAAS